MAGLTFTLTVYGFCRPASSHTVRGMSEKGPVITKGLVQN